MRLVANLFVTLDGVIQAPGGVDEDRSGGFDHGGWVAPHWDASMNEWITGWFEQADAFLLGRKTYDIFAGYWPSHSDPGDPVAGGLNTLPKYVASTTLDKVEWNNSTLLGPDLVNDVAALKDKPGRELQVHGSGNLLQTLISHQLVDEFRLIMFPILLGDGKKLFGRGTVPTALRVIETRSSPTGVVATRYEYAGEPTFADVTD